MSVPQTDAPIDVWLKWADYIDKLRLVQVDEVIILTKKLRLSAEYVTQMPTFERRHALKIVEQINKAEEEAYSKASNKASFKMPTNKPPPNVTKYNKK